MPRIDLVVGIRVCRPRGRSARPRMRTASILREQPAESYRQVVADLAGVGADFQRAGTESDPTVWATYRETHAHRPDHAGVVRRGFAGSSWAPQHAQPCGVHLQRHVGDGRLLLRAAGHGLGRRRARRQDPVDGRADPVLPLVLPDGRRLDDRLLRGARAPAAQRGLTSRVRHLPSPGDGGRLGRRRRRMGCVAAGRTASTCSARSTTGSSTASTSATPTGTASRSPHRSTRSGTTTPKPPGRRSPNGKRSRPAPARPDGTWRRCWPSSHASGATAAPSGLEPAGSAVNGLESGESVSDEH